MPTVTIHIQKLLYEALLEEQKKTGKGPSAIINQALGEYFAKKRVRAT